MKKIFTLIAFATLTLTASAKTIAYVSDTTRVRDAAIRAELAKTYTIVDVLGTSTGTKALCEASNIDMVLIAEPVGSAAAGMAELEGVNKPVLMMKVFSYKSAVWNWSATTVWGEDAAALTIEITAGQENHKIFTGLTSPISTITAVTSSKGIDYANFTPNLLTSGTITGLSKVGTNTCIFEISAGSVIGTPGNITIPQKFINFGINTLSQKSITADGLKLIVNICDYLTDGTTTEVKSQKAESKLKIVTGAGVLTVSSENEGTIEILTINGLAIAKKENVSDASFNLTQGAYIVRQTVGATTSAEIAIVK